MKLNEQTSMNARLVTEIQHQLDELINPDYTLAGKRWIQGALSALHALTDEVWELKRVEKSHAPIYYVENEDATERIIPAFLTFITLSNHEGGNNHEQL